MIINLCSSTKEYGYNRGIFSHICEFSVEGKTKFDIKFIAVIVEIWRGFEEFVIVWTICQIIVSLLFIIIWIHFIRKKEKTVFRSKKCDWD